jgi:hypothetical protein
MADLSRGFWTRETGMGQQVAQLHDRYMIMIMMNAPSPPNNFSSPIFSLIIKSKKFIFFHILTVPQY